MKKRFRLTKYTSIGLLAVTLNQNRWIFADFSANSEPINLKFFKGPFFILILTAVKISENYNEHFKS